eukprot:TRINITY_DN14660_c0_g1_i1.p1 TRINITY_DN14660_c0_g1~~TRINITY_DN14660_c0_g1_i1.p1  ORF type:complete len:348 (+),score=48.64 TRINITY_DN14660_c0_g1_i1:22-1044(+)
MSCLRPSALSSLLPSLRRLAPSVRPRSLSTSTRPFLRSAPCASFPLRTTHTSPFAAHTHTMAFSTSKTTFTAEHDPMDLSSNTLFDVSGKTVVITGGSRGIGLMIAAGFVQNNCKVYILSRSQEACDESAKILNAKGPGTAIPIAADFSTDTECRRIADLITSRESKVDVLVNNAGAAWGAPIDEYPDKAWSKLMDLNVRAVFNFTRACLPLLRSSATADSPSRVINIGSVHGIRVPSELETYAYSTSKAAVHQLTKALAVRLAKDQITVNAVACGPFPSKMMKHSLENFADSIIDGVPLKRIGAPSDAAGITLFLSSRAGAFLTGTIIPCDGGTLLANM